MATFNITGPDGQKYRVTGETAEGAVAALEQMLGQKPGGTSALGQFGSGAAEGLAGFTDLIGSGGVNQDIRIPVNDDMTVGTPVATPRENPTLKAFDPIISDQGPQTMGQRYSRRIGQELGFGIPAAALGSLIPGFGPVARAAMPAYMGASVAGDIGAGLAGQTAQEIAPGNATADLLASMIGGVGASAAVAGAIPKYKPAPSLDDVKGAAADKWRAVEGSDVRLNADALDELNGQMRDTLVKERATNPVLFPRANATIDDIAANPNPTLFGIEENRRIVGRNVAANADESRIGVAMKQKIDDYLNSLTPDKVDGANPGAAVADLKDARALTHRVKKAEEILNKEMRGETRAATTGTGGNEVNATRQNIRTVFDKERDPTMSGKRKGYTPDEMAQMERVVKGTPGQNIARLLGRMAPTSGALPMMATGYGGMAGVGAGMATGNPLLAIPALAGGAGFVGKEIAQQGTKREIAKLLAMILNGGPLEQSAASQGARAAIPQGLVTYSGQQ